MSETIHVAMCVDRGFALPLAVALASLDEASRGLPVHVHILYTGFATSLKKKVTTGLDELQVDWIALSDDAVHGAHHSDFLSSASLYRLLLDRILPPEISRVIYLDADTIVVDSLEPLFAAGLAAGQVVGAVPDAQAPWAAGPLGPPWQDLGLEPSSAYFNSGVMLIDLDRWRADEIGGQCLDLLRRVTPRWGDQDALNTILEGRWLDLPRRWNVQSADLRGDAIAWALWRDEVEAAIAEPAIIHFTEQGKPWLPGTDHPAAELWFPHLDRTAWSGWRPTEPRPRAWEKLARSAVQRSRRRRTVRLPE